jgi:hypothetical protein
MGLALNVKIKKILISAPLLANEAKLKREVNEHQGQGVLSLPFRIAT